MDVIAIAKIDIGTLRQRQSLPLEAKINYSLKRIEAFYNHYEGGCYISFSGGKDSTVMAHLIHTKYPDVPLVFCDTGLEYPEIRAFVNNTDNVQTIYPVRYDKKEREWIRISFREVIAEYGYPLISKEMSKNIYYGRKAKEHGDQKMYDHYVNGHRHNKKTKEDYIFMPMPQKWIPLFESDIQVSNVCCSIMKKNPFEKFERETGLKPFVGEMADDSRERETAYLKTGCNAFDDTGRPKSKPIAIWTEQDVLQYIYENKLKIASVYGDVVVDDGVYKTTGVSNTGCMFCGFGLHLQEEPNKFQQMKCTHLKQWDYCIRDTDKNGLGEGKIFDFLGIKYE